MASNDAGRFVSQSGMSPTWIVEAVDVSAKGQFGGCASLEDRSPDQLTLDRLEHRFHHRIMVAIALSENRYGTEGRSGIEPGDQASLMSEQASAAFGRLKAS